MPIEPIDCLDDIIDGVNLNAFNLNLLVALHALLAERSVTRAAKRCGITQSSMSYSLARLRERFDDPLLVRRGAELVPTVFAVSLTPRLDKMLAEVDALLEKKDVFEPATSTRRFRIGSSDILQMVALPALVDGELRDATGIDLVVQTAGKFMSERLADGTLDLAIDASLDKLPPGIAMREVLRQRYVCIARHHHPGLRSRVSLAAFCATPHLLVSQDEAPGLVDRALEAIGCRRRVALRVPDYGAVGHVIANTELIATVPELVATTLARSLPLQVLPLPFALRDFGIALYWHERQASDPGARWLRERFEALIPRLQKPKRLRRESHG